MRAIVTGGCGFIGSNLVDKLVDIGIDVFVIDDLSASFNETFYKNTNATYIHSDISLKKTINLLPKKCQWIFHLAAESRIQPTLENPARACRVNVEGTTLLLDYARKNGVEKFIYSSTSAGYGLRNQIPLKENMPNDCLNPYASTKLAGEDLCLMYYKLYKLKTIALRYFNVYGNRQPTKGQYAPVVGLFLKMKNEGRPMSIVGDGLQRRDFINVKDVVSANLKSAYSDDDIFGEVYNVGSGKNYSIIEIAEMIGGPYEHIPPRPGEARDTLADITKIKRNLNWYPTIEIGDWINEFK